MFGPTIQQPVIRVPNGFGCVPEEPRTSRVDPPEGRTPFICSGCGNPLGHYQNDDGKRDLYFYVFINPILSYEEKFLLFSCPYCDQEQYLVFKGRGKLNYD